MELRNRDERNERPGAAEGGLASRFPSDQALVDLVWRTDVSVRLLSCLRKAASEGALPLRTIGDYIAAGERAPSLMMRSVKGMGRKSARELDDIVRRAARETPGPAAAESDRAAGAGGPRELLARCFDRLRFPEDVTRDVDISVRLLRALETKAGPRRIRVKTLGDYIRDPAAARAVLAAALRVQRAALEELEEIIRGIVAAGLLRAGVDGPTARSLAENAVAGDPHPGAAVRAHLRRILADAGRPDSGPARSTGGGGPAASPEPSLERALPALRPREREVLIRRLALYGRPRETLSAIGADLGVTRERVRQIEKRALAKLRLADGARPGGDRR